MKPGWPTFQNLPPLPCRLPLTIEDIEAWDHALVRMLSGGLFGMGMYVQVFMAANWADRRDAELMLRGQQAIHREFGPHDHGTIALITLEGAIDVAGPAI